MDRFRDACEAGTGTTYDGTVIRGLAEGTLLVYGRVLRRLQRAARGQPTAPPRVFIQHRLLEIFSTNGSTSGIKLSLIHI